MYKKTKGHAGWRQATPKSSKSSCNCTHLAARIKAAIVTLALWGLLPVAVADWMTKKRRAAR